MTVCLGDARVFALAITDALSRVDVKATIVGAVRRMDTRMESIDVVACAGTSQVRDIVIDALSPLFRGEPMIGSGRCTGCPAPVSGPATRVPGDTPLMRIGADIDGLQVDVRMVPPAAVGAAVAVLTGPESYVSSLTRAARRRGMALTQSGLVVPADGGRIVPVPDEAALGRALGVSIPPAFMRG